MAYTEDFAKVEVLNEIFKTFGDGWKVYGNEPDNPFTVVANDELGIATQIYDKNYDLFRMMRYKWYHPKYTIVELEAKQHRRNHIGMFKTRDLIPTIFDQRRWYKQYVDSRKVKV